MPSMLYFDIAANFLSYIDDTDIKTLAACSLVCREWQELAGHRVWGALSLAPSRNRLLTRGTSAPNIEEGLRVTTRKRGRSVRELTLLDGEGEAEWMMSERLLPELLDTFTKVESLEFGRSPTFSSNFHLMESGRIPPRLLSAIHRLIHSRSMRRISLRGIMFTPNQRVALNLLLSKCSGLQSLELTRINHPLTAFGANRQTHTSISLKSLTVLQSTQPIMIWLLSPRSCISLDSLQAFDIDVTPSNVRTVQKVLDATPALKTLTMRCFSPDVDRLWVEQPLHLRGQPALSAITMVVVVVQDIDPFLWISNMLRSLRNAGTLETIGIDYWRQLSIPMGHDVRSIVGGWDEVEVLLDGQSFHRLKHVGLTLQYLNELTSNEFWESGAKFFGSRLVERGIMNITLGTRHML